MTGSAGQKREGTNFRFYRKVFLDFTKCTQQDDYKALLC